MDNFFDVIISGCGPSGSILGSLLAQKNIKVLILEKELFPRRKICAGGIQHRTLQLIPFDISQTIERTIYGIYFSLRNKDVFFKRYSEPLIYTVDRGDFDHFLAGEATKCGCLVNFGEKVVGFEVTQDSVEVRTNKSRYRARILAGADGVRGLVHRELTRGRKINRIIGYETKLENNGFLAGGFPDNEGSSFEDSRGNVFNLEESIRLDFNGVKKGYCWIFPKKTFMSCGMGAPFSDSRRAHIYLNEFIKEFYLKNKEQPLDIAGQSIPVRREDTPFCGFRVIALGDAACLGDGFTGEGLYNAVRSSFIASDCISGALKKSDYSFNDYFEKICGEIYRDIKISLLFTSVFYGTLLFFYKLLKRNDNYFNSCCKIMRGERSYQDVMKKLKILRNI